MRAMRLTACKSARDHCHRLVVGGTGSAPGQNHGSAEPDHARLPAHPMSHRFQNAWSARRGHRAPRVVAPGSRSPSRYRRAISAWPQTMPPARHSRSETPSLAWRRAASLRARPVAADLQAIESPRSCIHGANTSPRTRWPHDIEFRRFCSDTCFPRHESGYCNAHCRRHGLKTPRSDA